MANQYLTVDEIKAETKAKAEAAMRAFEARWGTRDVRAVATSVVKNADKVTWRYVGGR
jgi:hypothetical protein